MTDSLTNDELMFFDSRPAALPLYETLRQRLSAACGEADVRVQKTQITFRARYGFAFVSLRRLKGSPPVCILVSFGLGRRLSSPRVAVAVEPYPGRWTHHVVVSRPEDIDEELLGWLRQAREFAQSK